MQAEKAGRVGHLVIESSADGVSKIRIPRSTMKSLPIRISLALCCIAQAAVSAPALTGLHGFSVFPKGAQPEAPLIQGPDGSFYGTTANGGTNGGFGTVFRITSNAVAATLYTFSGGSDGSGPQAGLVMGKDGYLYGTTAFGGDNNGDGTIFRISTNGALTTLYTFKGGAEGSEPAGGLIQGVDGNLYGTTEFGGDANDDGTIFQITTSGLLTTLYTFTGGSDGSGPMAGLIQGTDGNLYGTAASGGDANLDGTIFQVTTNGAFTLLYTFTDGTDGSGPAAPLIQGFDGSFYGTAQFGGDANGDGTIFQVTTNGGFTSLYVFTGGSDGSGPAAGLLQDTNGILYGTTQFGGNANGDGTIFQITTNGAFAGMYEFANGTDGANPMAGLLRAKDGELYGTTSGGNTNGAGTIYRISTSGTYASWFLFPGINDGEFPSADLVLGQDGNFYGTAEDGGYLDNGVIFRATQSGVVTLLYKFGTMGLNTFGDGLDGSFPEGILVQGSDGTLYGTTSIGGANDDGTIFSITTNGVFTLLYTFSGTSDGSSPQAGLVFGNDGNLYGTASGGGDANGDGTIFQITTNGAFTTIYTFSGGSDGSAPWAPLIQGLDGNLYGTAEFGGDANGDGTIFQVSTSGAFVPLYPFANGVDGANPVAALVQGSDGLFYGTASSGGLYTNGTVFKIDSTGNFTVLAQFDGTNGAFPEAPLRQGKDGNFYGTTPDGGTNNSGTLFQVTPAGSLTTLWTFAGANDGANPDDALIPAANGVFYGLAENFGEGGNGEFFRLDLRPTIESISKTGTALAIDWAAVTGLNYQIQYSTNLTNSSGWVNLGTSIPGTNSTMQAVVSIGPDPRRFYRVALLP